MYPFILPMLLICDLSCSKDANFLTNFTLWEVWEGVGRGKWRRGKESPSRLPWTRLL